MTRPVARFGAVLLLVGTAAFATACASAQQPEPDGSQTAAPAPISPEPTPDTSPLHDEPGAEPTCETIIAPQIVEDFESVGWTARAERFRVGSVELPVGVQCVWGDFTTATDHVQIFGWAEITDADADAASKQLLDAGWRREDSNQGFIVTESEQTAFATDEDGYGLTYLFGDGWVKHADTRQSLLLVEWPRG